MRTWSIPHARMHTHPMRRPTQAKLKREIRATGGGHGSGRSVARRSQRQRQRVTNRSGLPAHTACTPEPPGTIFVQHPRAGHPCAPVPSTPLKLMGLWGVYFNVMPAFMGMPASSEALHAVLVHLIDNTFYLGPVANTFHLGPMENTFQCPSLRRPHMQR
jgi:hypothetical protein